MLPGIHNTTKPWLKFHKIFQIVIFLQNNKNELTWFISNWVEEEI